jgi:hypothetical protein
MQIWTLKNGKIAHWIKREFYFRKSLRVDNCFSDGMQTSLAYLIMDELKRTPPVTNRRYIVFNTEEVDFLKQCGERLLLKNERDSIEGEMLDVICEQIRKCWRGSFCVTYISENPNVSVFALNVKLRLVIQIEP